ncbi:hypothetical protein HGA91_01015 [candidate division WWE3 bacterium]|nr:hypothetical protein [candidate division WWE3 bacterium]
MIGYWMKKSPFRTRQILIGILLFYLPVLVIAALSIFLGFITLAWNEGHTSYSYWGALWLTMFALWTFILGMINTQHLLLKPDEDTHKKLIFWTFTLTPAVFLFGATFISLISDFFSNGWYL